MKNLLNRATSSKRLHNLRFGLCLSLVAAATGFQSDPAQAQEIMPYEFTPLPAGTNLALGYYAYGHNTDYRLARGPTLRGSGLETHVGVARFVHYDEIAGFRAGYQIYQGFGGLQDARIGGQRLPNTFGAQNITLSAFLWPYINESSKTAIILVGFLNPPTGSYDPFAPLNLGDNRVRGTVQGGLQQGFGNHLSLDIAYDAQFYGDNDRAFPGTSLLRQGTTHRLQTWLNWRWNPSFNTSIGYTGIWGGEQRLNGVLNGARTEIQRIRFQTGYFFDPTLQVALELNHDLQATGGFKQDFGAVFRILKAF
ncbi:transporter [Methylobacterium sp. NEAU 140]|uniref:transporter n=1 Tax=Methylobacterium sp. NEAU 140 TaxID=3064945 RepID=UPI00273442E4|nr:transporter [Methylobacterium sp. NEAU 140]MDP4027095.1 transporter [Methylobacterium sp. NEAU 140]